MNEMSRFTYRHIFDVVLVLYAQVLVSSFESSVLVFQVRVLLCHLFSLAEQGLECARFQHDILGELLYIRLRAGVHFS